MTSNEILDQLHDLGVIVRINGPKVRLEPARSAEPPSNSGSRAPSAFKLFCDALREAMVSPSD